MKQHSIDLMPLSIRKRNQAGLRTGRFLVIAGLVMLVTISSATHSRLRAVAAHERLLAIRSQAQSAMEVDRQVTALKAELQQREMYFRVYDKVSLPMDISAVMATVINALPDSVTLDQFDIDAGVRATSRSPRSKAIDNKGAGPQRLLVCEISGFAATDEHIAHLVSKLENTAPFRNVNLDFSRTRKVHERDAREFRLSFKVDLSAAYAVTYVDPNATGGGSREH